MKFALVRFPADPRHRVAAAQGLAGIQTAPAHFSGAPFRSAAYRSRPFERRNKAGRQ